MKKFWRKNIRCDWNEKYGYWKPKRNHFKLRTRLWFWLRWLSKTDYINMKTSVFSAGAMYSTANDMKKWDDALYTNILLNEDNKKFISRLTLVITLTVWIFRNIRIFRSGKDITTIDHSGGINGFSCNIARIPEDKIYVILLDNTRAGKEVDNWKLLLMIFSEFYITQKLICRNH